MTSTSMTMTLAQGIINRDIRNLEERPFTLSDVHTAINKMSKIKRKNRIKKVEELLNNAQCFWYRSNLDDRNNQDTIDCWEWTGTDFRFALFVLGKHGVTYKSANLYLKRHTLARIVFRRHLKNMRQAFGELRSNGLGNVLAIGQVTELGQQTSYPTDNGIAFVKMGEDGKRVIPTWVDNNKLGQQQRICNNTEYDVAKQLADAAGLSLEEWFNRNPSYKKALEDWAVREGISLDGDTWMTIAIAEMKLEHEKFINEVYSKTDNAGINIGVPDIIEEAV